MILSESIATTIVTEINKIIPMKINIMNEKGVIIASSDEERIGSFHEGAYQMVNAEYCELRVNYDGEYSGARKGLNYPIKFQDYIVGVIGITGVYDEIKDSSGIIKKMTELLLENIYSVEQRQMRENIYTRYLSDWVNEKQLINDDFLEQGKLLGFDITIRRRFVVCSLDHKQSGDVVSYLQQTEESKKALKDHVSRLHPDNIYFEEGHFIVCAIIAKDDHDLVEQMSSVVSEIESNYDVTLRVGVDSAVADYRFAKKAYYQASKANQTCIRKKYVPIVFYDDLHLELFSNELDYTVKKEFINRLFKRCTPQEVGEMMHFLDTYYHYDGSIQEVSKKLYIHKNTTQNRLHSIIEVTGFDPRSLKEATVFNIALHFYKEIEGLY